MDEAGRVGARSGLSTIARLGLTLALLAALLSCLAARAAAEAPTYDLQGNWATGYENGEGVRETANGSYAITSMNMSSGAFSGTATVEGTGFQLEGTESGAVARFTLTEGSYVAYDTLHLTEQSGVVGGSGVFASGGYSEEGSPFWAELVGDKRPSSAKVVCNYETATSNFDCAGIVGDASGEEPADTPTGSIGFTATSGSFPDGASCQLVATPDSDGVAECSVVYQPPAGGIPTGTPAPVTVIFPGDSNLAPSEAGDKALSKTPNAGETAEEEALRHAAEKLEAEFEKAAAEGWHEYWPTGAVCRAKSAANSQTTGLLAGEGAAASSSAWAAVSALPIEPLAGQHPSAKHTETGPLDLAAATRRALKILRPGKQPTASTLAVIAQRKPLKKGSKLGELRAIPGPEGAPTPIHERAWLFWESTELGGRFPHASALVAVGARSGRVLYARAMEGIPTVNGHIPAFVGTPLKGRFVYSRSTRIHISKVALRRVEAAQTTVGKLLHHKAKARKPKKKAHRGAHKSDASASADPEAPATPSPPADATPSDPPAVNKYPHSRVFVMGGGTALLQGETFPQEVEAIQKVFQAHGVESADVSNMPLTATPTPQLSPGVFDGAASLGSTVRYIHEEEGINSLTIYATGHGSLSMSPTGKLLDAGILVGNDTGGSQLLRASTIAAIAKANPDVHINLIIDGCHSGAFIDLLAGIPNVGTITTAAAANEISYSPGTVEVYDPTHIPSQQDIRFNPGVQPKPGQLIFNSVDTPEGAISPFTTGEVQALNAVFKAVGDTGGSLDEIVQRAGAVEPQYDAAAQLGETHPSEATHTIPGCGEGNEESDAKGA